MSKCEVVYNILMRTFPDLFPPLIQIRKVNEKAFQAYPRSTAATQLINIKVDPSLTVGELCADISKKGAQLFEVVYSEGGKDLYDEVYDEETMDYHMDVVGKSTESIFVKFSIKREEFRAEEYNRKQTIIQIEDAKKQNEKNKSLNLHAEESNKRNIKMAQTAYPEYWKAACIAESKKDYSILKDLIRQSLHKRLSELD